MAAHLPPQARFVIPEFQFPESRDHLANGAKYSPIERACERFPEFVGKQLDLNNAAGSAFPHRLSHAIYPARG